MQFNKKVQQILDDLYAGESGLVSFPKRQDSMKLNLAPSGNVIFLSYVETPTDYFFVYSINEDMIINFDAQNTREKNVINTILNSYKSAYYVQLINQGDVKYKIEELTQGKPKGYQEIMQSRKQDMQASLQEAQSKPGQRVTYTTVAFMYGAMGSVMILDAVTSKILCRINVNTKEVNRSDALNYRQDTIIEQVQSILFK